MFAPMKILVPTDFSVYADNALKVAVDIAKQNKARIYLIHVIDDRINACIGDYCLDNNLLQKMYDDSIKSSKNKLQKEVKKVTDKHSGVEIVCEVKAGIPYEVILEEQVKENIDLIVIASHGKSGILKNFMGNVVDKVVKRAQCQILLVRNA